MKISAQIESLLFSSAKPMTPAALASALDTTAEEIDIALAELMDDLADRGIRLVRNEKRVMLVTAPQMAEQIEMMRSQEAVGELTSAARETLAIVLYKGTITKPEIDFIRGVNSQFILRNLLQRGLIERTKRKRSVDYSPSLRMLQYLGVESIQDLPRYGELAQLLASIDSSSEASEPAVDA